jgi:hypothetical protein
MYLDWKKKIQFVMIQDGAANAKKCRIYNLTRKLHISTLDGVCILPSQTGLLAKQSPQDLFAV